MNDNKELIGQLEQLDQLIDENENLNFYIEHGAAREALEQIAVIREKRGQAPKAPSVYTTMPVYPLNESVYLPLEKSYNLAKKIFFGALGVTVLMAIIYMISKADFFNTLSTIGIMGSIVSGIYHSKIKGQYKDKKKTYDESVKTFERTMGAFRKGLANLDQEKQTALDELNAYKQLNAVCYEEYTVAFNQYSDNIDNAKAIYAVNSDQINSSEVLPVDYHHLVKPIISILKSGRADTYKEALNLAIDEERQEREAAARREAEARRQAEEERRTEIMRRQAEEERRHNEQMERQQAEQAREAARQQQAAQRQQAEQAREAARQQSRQESIGRSKCHSCANYSHCPSHVKKSGAGLTCGGYRPR